MIIPLQTLTKSLQNPPISERKTREVFLLHNQKHLSWSSLTNWRTLSLRIVLKRTELMVQSVIANSPGPQGVPNHHTTMFARYLSFTLDVMGHYKSYTFVLLVYRISFQRSVCKCSFHIISLKKKERKNKAKKQTQKKRRKRNIFFLIKQQLSVEKSIKHNNPTN